MHLAAVLTGWIPVLHVFLALSDRLVLHMRVVLHLDTC